MTETTAAFPSYEKVVSHFDWETVIAQFDWPVNEKFNVAHEICDRWANDPAKAEQVALYYETRDGTRGSYTYRQLRDLSNRFADVLVGLGVKPGDRIGGLLPKRLHVEIVSIRLERGLTGCTSFLLSALVKGSQITLHSLLVRFALRSP